MKKIMVFVAVFLIMICSVFAESGFVQAWGEGLTELEGKTLPGALGTLFGNEQINFHIKLDNNNEAVFGLVMENKVVKSVTSAGVAKPTLNVYTSEAVIREIVSSASPPQALLNALKEEKITYKAVGFFNKIKFAFLSVFTNIAALFASEEAEPVEEKVAAGDIAGVDTSSAGTAADSTAAGACAAAGGCPNTGACATAGGCSDSGAVAGATPDTTACSTTTAGCPTTGACATAGGCTDTSATTSTGGTTTDTTAGATTGTDGTTTDTAGTDTTAATDTTTTAGTLTTGAVADIPTGETHVVKMTNEGFSKSLLTINAGDTVVWENVRTGSVLNKAMIIGVRDCRNIKSKFFLPGESFSWTFEEPGECVVVDGIMTTQSSRIIIG